MAEQNLFDKNMEKEYRYKVATLCYTYNHGPFVKTALDGFSMQKTSFPCVSIIVDDASTDETAEIIQNYLEDNFDFTETSVAYKKETEFAHICFARHKNNKSCFFAVLFLKENHHSKRKPKDVYFKEWIDNSKFIAFCEGDDYWTNPNKLQVQVNAMEQHPELDISAHAFKRVHALTGEIVDERLLSKENVVFPIETVIMGEGGFVGTPTVMITQTAWKKKETMPFWKGMDYDYTVQIGGALRGGLLYLKESMVEKRTRVPGSFTDFHREASKREKVEYNERKAKMLLQLDEETGGKYHDTIYARILLNNIRSYNTGKENRHFLVTYHDGYRIVSLKEKIRFVILCYFSWIVLFYRILRNGEN